MSIEPVLENVQPDLFGESAVPYVPARPDKTAPVDRRRNVQVELFSAGTDALLSVAHDGRTL